MPRSVLVIACVVLATCTFEQTPLPDNGYPPEIARIVVTHCSTTGCHTSNARTAAGGLSMETWNQLFEGGNGGAVVIPYRPDQSWIMFYTNTDTARGVVLLPTMPFNRPPLTTEQWETLFQWIAEGAPNKWGKIAFPPQEGRRKIYVGNQGCDVVTVFDAATRLAMRYIDVGEKEAVESPHQIRVSPDLQHWYVIKLDGTTIEKFSTYDDTRLGYIEIGVGYWNTLAITDDGRYGYAVDWSDVGKVAIVDLAEMKLITHIQGLIWPHGSWVNKAGTILYVTSQYGNYIYKLDVRNPHFVEFEKVVLNPPATPNNFQGYLDPHEVMLSPDESRYFVTCQASNEVRVFDAATDALVKTIPVGMFPQEMAISHLHPYLFVTCYNDPCLEPRCRGSVYVINYKTLEVVKILQENMYQPHGIAVLDDLGYVVVANRNLDPDGPPPHHSSACGGRNGYIQFFDLATLAPIAGFKSEVSVDPYTVAVR